MMVFYETVEGPHNFCWRSYVHKILWTGLRFRVFRLHSVLTWWAATSASPNKWWRNCFCCFVEIGRLTKFPERNSSSETSAHQWGARIANRNLWTRIQVASLWLFKKVHSNSVQTWCWLNKRHLLAMFCAGRGSTKFYERSPNSEASAHLWVARIANLHQRTRVEMHCSGVC